MTTAPVEEYDALRQRVQERVRDAAAARARLVRFERALVQAREDGEARRLASLAR